MQYRAMQIANELFGEMPDNRHTPRLWLKMLDTYLLVQHLVDIQAGCVLDALANSPFADDTIVVFTSDPGEYAGAHGMRGKGFGFYDEGCRVPLIDGPVGRMDAAGRRRPHAAGHQRRPRRSVADRRQGQRRVAREHGLHADRVTPRRRHG